MAMAELAGLIRSAKGWDNTLRQIMLAGKVLSTLPEHERTESNYVKGCESDVWLKITMLNDQITVRAFSPSKIIRGVLAIIIEKAETLTLSELVDFDFEAYLSEIGMQRYLSESRGNGVTQVVKAIQSPDSLP